MGRKSQNNYSNTPNEKEYNQPTLDYASGRQLVPEHTIQNKSQPNFYCILSSSAGAPMVFYTDQEGSGNDDARGISRFSFD